MSSVNDAIRLLHSYARNSGNPHISFENLSTFKDRFIEHNVEKQPDLTDLAGSDGLRRLVVYLNQLEERNWLTLERNPADQITSVYYRNFFAAEIKQWYHRIQEDHELAFPSDENLRMTIPDGLVATVQVSQNLMDWLKNENADPQQILFLHFPENVRSMYTTVELLQKEMPQYVVYRLREYLRSEKNSSYMESKLRAVFRTREVLVHELLQTILTKPDEGLSTIKNPNEFHFHFWTQLSSTIIKDFSKKNEKLDMEHTYCQAAYLLGYMSVHFKGMYQKVREREESEKLLNDKLIQPPYLFTMQQIYDLKDDKGVPLTKRIPKEEINEFIEQLMTPEKEEEVSKLVSINVGSNRAMVIHRTQYVPVLIKRLSKLSRTIQQKTANKMTDLLYDDITEKWMEDDNAFDEYLRDQVFEIDSIVYSMLEFKVLFLVVDGQDLPAGQRDVVYRFFDRQRSSMMPWYVILSLDRERLLKDAKLRLPIWMLIPVIRGIVRLFRKKKPQQSHRSSSSNSVQTNGSSSGSSGSSRAEQLKEYRKVIVSIQSRYVSEGQSVGERLKELHSSWNPLIDNTSKANLLEDVNSLCRDTLRRMKLTARAIPPSAERIEELAKRIATNSAFDRIRDRKSFQDYLELYMLSILGK